MFPTLVLKPLPTEPFLDLAGRSWIHTGTWSLLDFTVGGEGMGHHSDGGIRLKSVRFAWDRPFFLPKPRYEVNAHLGPPFTFTLGMAAMGLLTGSEASPHFGDLNRTLPPLNISCHTMQ